MWHSNTLMPGSFDFSLLEREKSSHAAGIFFGKMESFLVVTTSIYNVPAHIFLFLTM